MPEINCTFELMSGEPGRGPNGEKVTYKKQKKNFTEPILDITNDGAPQLLPSVKGDGHAE